MRAAVLLLLLTTGCGVFSDREPDWPKVQNQANVWRLEVNGMVEAIAPFADDIGEACAELGSSSDSCRELRAAYAGARAGTDGAHTAIDLYEMTGAHGERVERAINGAHTSVRVVEAAIARLREVLHVDRQPDQPCGQGARRTAQETGAGSADDAAAGAGEAPAAAAGGEDGETP